MSESNIYFNLPGLWTLDRIEELESCISNFPESKLVPAWKEELEKLAALAKYL